MGIYTTGNPRAKVRSLAELQDLQLTVAFTVEDEVDNVITFE